MPYGSHLRAQGTTADAVLPSLGRHSRTISYDDEVSEQRLFARNGASGGLLFPEPQCHYSRRLTPEGSKTP